MRGAAARRRSDRRPLLRNRLSPVFAAAFFARCHRHRHPPSPAAVAHCLSRRCSSGLCLTLPAFTLPSLATTAAIVSCHLSLSSAPPRSSCRRPPARIASFAPPSPPRLHRHQYLHYFLLPPRPLLSCCPPPPLAAAILDVIAIEGAFVWSSRAAAFSDAASAACELSSQVDPRTGSKTLTADRRHGSGGGGCSGSGGIVPGGGVGRC